MLNNIVKLFSPRGLQFQVPFCGLLVTVGLFCSEAKPVLTKELQTQATSALVVRAGVFEKEATSAPRGKLPKADGIYLYGRTPKPEQMGQEYMVFEVRQGKVTGAFYLPSSEFSCFQGTLQSGELALIVANSSDSDADSDLASQNSQKLATASNRPPIGDGYNPLGYSYSVLLQNYYQLPSVSANDKRILATCKNNQN